MQLILDTECSIDIKRNMSTLSQESLEEKLDDVIHELKTDICNSNKENIQSKDNIIVTSENDLCADGDKINGEEFVEVKSPKLVPNAENSPANDTNTDKQSEQTASENNQQEPNPATLEELNKDEDSDPIILTHASNELNMDTIEDTVVTTDVKNEDEVTLIENKENTCIENFSAVKVTEDTDCLEENDVLIAESPKTEVNLVETVDLDDEEKESAPEELEANKEKCSPVTDSKEICIENTTTEVVSQEDDVQLEEVKVVEVEPVDVDTIEDDREICTNEKDKVSDEDVSEEPSEPLVQHNDIEVRNIDTSMKNDESPNKSVTSENNVETEEHTKEVICESTDGLDIDMDIVDKVQSNTLNDKPLETQVTDSLVTDLKNIPSVLKLSNTLDILSDDDEMDPPKNESQNNVADNTKEKPCIQIEDDDDIMLIDEDTNSKGDKDSKVAVPLESGHAAAEEIVESPKSEQKEQIVEETVEQTPVQEMPPFEKKTIEMDVQTAVVEKKEDVVLPSEAKPLLSTDFWQDHKKNLADMTRDDLEELCIMKIVESIVDRSNLSEIKTKLKTMAQNIEEYKKKAMMLTKQNRDLQVVLKSVQEEQKKMPESPITPLKITRSVGMQVLMTEKAGVRRKGLSNQPTSLNGGSTINSPNNINNNNKSTRLINSVVRPAKPPPTPQSIPVPRLVLASNTASKNSNVPQVNTNNSGKASPLNGVKNSPPVSKGPEKRPHNRIQSVTVDLTDDEPPSKVLTRNSPLQVITPAIKPVNPQNMVAPQRHPLAQNSPRKVYIPISGPQNQSVRPGQTIMLKSVPQVPGLRHRAIAPTPRMPQNQVRMPRIQNRHPAPLPEVKQYQTNHYKALPPAPDLKLSKVENGIVISWKIEGYQQDSYEEIASYQLYAYQETLSPPSTSLWKKIGDVKALPLPMACTLTQFMAGFKYYFAVRAVDIRSRYGPFSLPGSIILLNKM